MRTPLKTVWNKLIKTTIAPWSRGMSSLEGMSPNGKKNLHIFGCADLGLKLLLESWWNDLLTDTEKSHQHKKCND